MLSIILKSRKSVNYMFTIFKTEDSAQIKLILQSASEIKKRIITSEC